MAREEKEEEKEEKENNKLIKKKDREILQQHFQALKNPVDIFYFTQENECQFCRETHQILSELATLSGKLKLTVYDFLKDSEKAAEFKIDKIPATVVFSERDYGIRFFGVVAGYEFTPLVFDIMTASQRNTALQPETKKRIRKIKEDIHIQVFTTLTCPYCPQAVQVAHQFAIESDSIRADMIEAAEFPHLAQKYEVFAVPKVVINETHTFEGILPEKKFADEIEKAIEK